MKLIPGKFYFLWPKDGSCDNCGAEIIYKHALPAVFVGEYEDEFGKYHLWELAIWGFCKACRLPIESIRVNIQPATIDKIELFQKSK